MLKRRAIIFIFLIIVPLYTYFSFLTKSYFLTGFISEIVKTISLPGIVVSLTVNNIVCGKWLNYPYYDTCDFFASPLFAHIFLISEVVTTLLITIFIDKIIEIVKKRYLL